MTNQTRDFDQSDAEVLANLVGLEIDSINGGVVFVYPPHKNSWDVPFRPWSKNVAQWQIQSLLDAVRKKGLEEEFLLELQKLTEPEQPEVQRLQHDMNMVSAPPEAICSAILSMEKTE